MKPINFKEQNVVYAKDQPEYMPLPALVFQDGEVMTCWKLSWKELLKVVFTRKIYLSVQTFRRPLQPLYMTVSKERIIVQESFANKREE
jgi:hypothetical protein